MSNLEVRVRTDYMLVSEGLPVAEIPFRLEIIQRITQTLADIGGELFGVDLSHDDLQMSYSLAEDGNRVFLDVYMNTANIT